MVLMDKNTRLKPEEHDMYRDKAFEDTVAELDRAYVLLAAVETARDTLVRYKKL